MKSLKILTFCLLCSFLCTPILSWSMQCSQFLLEVRSEAELKEEIMAMFYGEYTQTQIASELGISVQRVAYLEVQALIEANALRASSWNFFRKPKDVLGAVRSWARVRSQKTGNRAEYDLRKSIIFEMFAPYGVGSKLFELPFIPESLQRQHTPAASGLAWASGFIRKKKVLTGYKFLYNILSKNTFKFWQRANDLPDHAFNPEKHETLRAQRAAEFEVLTIQTRFEDSMPAAEALVDKFAALNRALEIEQQAINQLSLTYERLIEAGFSIPRPDVEVDISVLPPVVADYVTQRAQWIDKQQEALFSSGAIPRETLK